MNAPSASPRPGGVARAGAVRGFVPALEGLRALAALGVLTTHVAFQTGSATGSALHRTYGRLDLAVAVFFALSGFLLWRTHAAFAWHAATGDRRTARRARPYLRSRLARIMPAYLVLVVSALVVLPGNAGTGPVTWLANLTLTQVYVPRTLTDGLTHAWSLAVEMAFYLVLPLLWWAMAGLRGDRARWRLPAIAVAGVLSLAWGLVPWHALGLPAGSNDQILPPAFGAWFAAGMLLAELAAAPPGRLARLARGPRARWGWWLAAALAFGATIVPAWFSEGFVHPSGPEFAARTGLGALVGFLLLVPVVLAPRTLRFPVLGSAPLRALGRWSYGLFLWHVVVLHFAFQVLGVPPFSGHMPAVWLATVAGSVVIAAASYAWVEEPAREALDGRPPRSPAGQTAATPAQASPDTVSNCGQSESPA